GSSGHESDEQHSVERFVQTEISCRECLRLNSFSPTAVVSTLKLNGDRAVSVDRLFACPSHRFVYPRANLELGRQLDLAAVAFGKQKRSLADTATMGMPGIQSAAQIQFLVGTFQLQP